MSYFLNNLTSLIRPFSPPLITMALILVAAAMPVTAGSHHHQSNKPILRYDISGSSAWYPYFIPDSKKPGIVAELVAAVLVEADIEGQQVALPPKRTVMALSNGELDFDVSSPSWFADNKVPDGFVLSDGLIEIKEYIVTLPHNVPRFNQTSSLLHQNIGTVRGYFYKNDSLFNRVDFISESKLIKALLMGRVDAVIMGDLPARYWAQQNKTKIAFGAVNSKGDLHFRLRDNHAHLLPQINAAIKKLKQQGKVSAIVSQYLSVIPDTALVIEKTHATNAE